MVAVMPYLVPNFSEHVCLYLDEPGCKSYIFLEGCYLCCLPGNIVAHNTLLVEFQFKRNQHFTVTRKWICKGVFWPSAYYFWPAVIFQLLLHIQTHCSSFLFNLRVVFLYYFALFFNSVFCLFLALWHFIPDDSFSWLFVTYQKFVVAYPAVGCIEK